MTHEDIYEKFMIEYDKANITSSYPSLTKYEIATILNKAYLALIAQKVTGNNQRKVPFEYDTKAIEDVRPLITTKQVFAVSNYSKPKASNELIYYIPDNMLYYLQSMWNNHITTLVNHQIANSFKVTAVNVPWIKNPVCYLEGDFIHILKDPYETSINSKLDVTYIYEPKKFDEGTDNTEFELSDTMAEELINLAILFATETVESPRVQTKSQLMTLEA